MRFLSLFLVLSLFGPRFAMASVVANVMVTVLSTMLSDRGIGEWGFAALVEADGRQLLVDTGAKPDTVLQNARELGIDLSKARCHSSDQPLARLGRGDAARQQPHPNPVLEIADCLAECRLRDAEPLRCPREAPLLRHRDESREIMEVVAARH